MKTQSRGSVGAQLGLTVCNPKEVWGPWVTEEMNPFNSSDATVRRAQKVLEELLSHCS